MSTNTICLQIFNAELGLRSKIPKSVRNIGVKKDCVPLPISTELPRGWNPSQKLLVGVVTNYEGISNIITHKKH